MRRFLLFLLLLLLGTTACQQNSVPEITAEEIVLKSAQRMAETTGFRFRIGQEGTAVYLDPDGLLALGSAEGVYTAPDKTAATVKIIAPGFITDVDVISIGETQWQTNVLTQKWEELPPNWGFNPTVLFDRESGLQAILAQDMTDLQFAGTENLANNDGPDAELYKISGNVAGDRLLTMSGGLIGNQAVTVTLWVQPDSFEVVRITVDEPVPDAEASSRWQIDFANYDQTVEIEPPLD